MTTESELPIRELPKASNGSTEASPPPFDILADFHRHLSTNADITPSVAAIASLMSSIVNSPDPPTTAHEAMDVLRASASTLRRGVADPLPLIAGIHGLLAWMITHGGDLLKRLEEQEEEEAVESAAAAATSSNNTSAPPPPPPPQPQGFANPVVRTRLLANSRQLVAAAMQARATLGERAAALLLRGGGGGASKVFVTYGASRAVLAAFLAGVRDAERRRDASGASEEEGKGQGSKRTTPNVPFDVVWVLADEPASSSSSSFRASAKPAASAMIATLRAAGVRVSVLPASHGALAVGAVRPRAAAVLVGAEVVCQSGGIVGAVGTGGLAARAADAGVPFYVLAETHKFAPFVMPRPEMDMRLLQTVGEEEEEEKEKGGERGKGVQVVEEPREEENIYTGGRPGVPVDYTRGELIRNIITEDKVMQPAHVVAHLLGIYDLSCNPLGSRARQNGK